MVSGRLVLSVQANDTCSRVPKKHNIEPFFGERSTLAYIDVDLVHYLEHLLLNRLQTNHLHDRVDVGIHDAVGILSTLPVGLSLGFPLLLFGVLRG